MKLIKSIQIEEYVKNNKKEAEKDFPYIIRMLLKNTVNDLTGIDIPNGDNIVQTGFDGIIKFNGNNKYLGDKNVCMEIGTNADYIGKANEDISKRNPNKNENFVFVTPYRWNNRKTPKSVWINEKKKEYCWNDIKIIDSSVLEDWLEEDIITSKYLLNKLEIKTNDIYSISEKEEDYVNKTINGINLDFFNYEDKDYEQLLSNLSKSYYNVVAPTREEGMFVTLYYLRKIGKETNTLIIESELTWKKVVSEKIINNGILIPNFYHSNNLEIPPNNTTILIYDEEEFTNNSDYTINNRTINNLNNALSNYYKNSDGSKDYDKVNSIINKSLGKYIPLKREIFKELSKPNWYNEDNVDLYLYLFFINNFKSKDIKLFEEFGIDTKELKKTLNKITREKDPYVVYYKYWDNYRVVNIYNAIDWLGSSIDENIIEKLIKLARKVLFYIEPKYSLQNIDKKYYIEDVDSREYSSFVKDGVLKGLIVTKLYLKRNNYNLLCRKLDKLIDEYYSSISTQSDFLSFANIACKLVEFNYEKYLDKIKQSVNNKDFQKLFNLKNKDPIFSSNEYCNILWGIEKAISKKEYISDAIETLALLAEMKGTDYQNMSNTPFNTLRDVFLGWDNLTCLTFDEKIKLLKKIIKGHKELGKKLLKNVFPNDNCYWSQLQKPEFDSYDEIIKIKYVSEQIKYFNAYYVLYLDNYVEKLEDIVPIYDEVYFVDFDCFALIKERTLELIKISNDEEKFSLKFNISEKLRGFEKFHNSAWNLNDKQLNYLSDIENKIKYENLIYDYLYAYSYNGVLYGDDVKEARVQAMALSKNNDFNENLLLKRCDNKRDVVIDIYKYNHNCKHNIKFIKKLYSNYKDCIYSYLREIYANEDLDSIIEIYNDDELQEVPVGDRILILTELGYNEKIYNEIKGKSYENIYWQKLNFFNGKCDDFVYNSCFKYGNFKMCLDYISKKDDLYDEKCELLEKIISSNYVISEIEKYQVEEIFDGFHNCDKRTDYERLAKLEIYFSPILSNKTYFLSREACKFPSIVAELAELIYKGDNGESNDFPNKDVVVSNCLTLLRHLKIDFDNENALQWCEDFKKIMIEKNRSKIMYHILGQLLAKTSADEEDKMFPSKNVRKIIEYYKSDELNNSFAIAKYNGRGIHSIGIGEEEADLYKMYSEWSKNMAIEYKETSKILKSLADIYKKESDEIRDEANYV